MTNKHISLAPVPDPDSIRAAMARAEALRMFERTQALSLWEQGLDTKDIASRIGRPESWVYNSLSKLRQQARGLT